MTAQLDGATIAAFLFHASYKGRDPIAERKANDVAHPGSTGAKCRKMALLFGMRGNNLGKILNKSQNPAELKGIADISKDIFVKTATLYPEYMALGRSMACPEWPTTFLVKTWGWTKEQWMWSNEMFCRLTGMNYQKFAAVSGTIWDNVENFVAVMEVRIMAEVRARGIVFEGAREFAINALIKKDPKLKREDFMKVEAQAPLLMPNAADMPAPAALPSAPAMLPQAPAPLPQVPLAPPAVPVAPTG